MGLFDRSKKQASGGKASGVQSWSNPLYEGDESREFTNPLYGQQEEGAALGSKAAPSPAPTEHSEPEAAPEPEEASEPEAAPEQQMDEEDHAELAQVQGRAPLRDLQELLQGSEKGGIHSSGPNSDAFNAVTQSITTLNTLMDMRKFGGDIAADIGLLVTMKDQYKVLIKDCDRYLRHHSLSRAGRARKGIVRRISQLAQCDIQGLRLASDQIGKASQAERAAMTWDDLLQKSRAVKITINTTFVGSEKATGGAVSDVKKLKSDNAQVVGANGESQALGGLKFFKTQEVVNPELSITESAVKKVMADFPTMPEEFRPILNRIVYNDSTGDFVDPETGQLPRVWKRIMEPLAAYYTSFKGMKEQLLEPSGLTGVGQIEMSGRNVATSRLADLLGVGNLIARSELAEVTDSEGTTRKGIIMDAAKGKGYAELTAMSNQNGTQGAYARSDTNLIAPSFLRDITNLQALDIICGQMDRHANNMHYQTDDTGRLTGVMGIDNDAAFGTNDNAISMKRGGDRFDRAVYDDDNNLVIPHLDKAFAERVLALSDSSVRFAMRDLIGKPETDALLVRLKKLKKAIANATPGQLLEKEEDWNGAVQQEMIAANDTRDNERAVLDRYDVQALLMERYHVDNPEDLPDGPEKEQAREFRDAMMGKQNAMMNKEMNRGSNYLYVTAAL